MEIPFFINIKDGSAWVVERHHGIVHAKSLSSTSAIGVAVGRREVACNEDDSATGKGASKESD